MIPKLRFSEFKESWSEVLLETVSQRVTGHTPSKKHKEYYGEDHYWVSLQDSSSLDNRYIYETKVKITALGIENSSAVLLPIETVIMTRDAGVGKLGVLGLPMAVSQHFVGWICKPNLNQFFLYYSLYRAKPEFERIAVGNTIKTIGMGYFKKMKVVMPNLSEQKRISKLLFRIDDKINLLTKKKEALETYKKGLMQKIFSQEHRFKREDGTDYPEWGIQTLDKLCSICKSGGTPKSTVAEYYNGNIPFLAISDITEQGKYLRSTSKSISELGIENSASWIVPKHSVIYSMYASVGFVSINLIPLATSQAVLNLIVDERICLTEYLYYWLYQFQKNVHVYVTTGTQGNLNAQTVKSFQVDLPSIKEQEKIILTLSKIDEQISFMHTQIENATSLKKGLLQQMFV